MLQRVLRMHLWSRTADSENCEHRGTVDMDCRPALELRLDFPTVSGLVP